MTVPAFRRSESWHWMKRFVSGNSVMEGLAMRRSSVSTSALSRSVWAFRNPQPSFGGAFAARIRDARAMALLAITATSYP